MKAIKVDRPVSGAGKEWTHCQTVLFGSRNLHPCLQLLEEYRYGNLCRFDHSGHSSYRHVCTVSASNQLSQTQSSNPCYSIFRIPGIRFNKPITTFPKIIILSPGNSFVICEGIAVQETFPYHNRRVTEDA